MNQAAMGDVVCCGMFRAASTWLYHVTLDLLPGATDLGFVDNGAAYLALGSPGVAERRVLKTHDRHEAYEGLLRSGVARGLYSYRDLRDVCYSFAFKLARSFDEVVGLLHPIMENDRFWTAQPSVCVLRYETIVTDPVRAIGGVADFLGVATDPAVVATWRSLEEERKRDPGHVRTGEVGSWRTLATHTERVRMATLIQGWLVARGYETNDRWVGEI